jgi:hypothetical protein
MRRRRKHAVLYIIALCLLIVLGWAACSSKPKTTETEKPDPTEEDTYYTPDESPSDNTPEISTMPPSTPEQDLVPYDGIVEHLFFHEVIAYPQLAFNGNSSQSGYDENMVTVSEYNKILDSIYKKGYILVNMNDVWSEYTNENGQQRMQKNTLMLPEGKNRLYCRLTILASTNTWTATGSCRN